MSTVCTEKPKYYSATEKLITPYTYISQNIFKIKSLNDLVTS